MNVPSSLYNEFKWNQRTSRNSNAFHIFLRYGLQVFVGQIPTRTTMLFNMLVLIYSEPLDFMVSNLHGRANDGTCNILNENVYINWQKNNGDLHRCI